MTTEPLKSGCAGVVCVSSTWEAGGAWTHQWFGVAEDVVLQELVQHVEEVVLHQCLDHQLVQVVLRKQSTHQSTHPLIDRSVYRGNLSERLDRDGRRHSAAFYLDGDLELVQRADVLHQHGDDKLMRNTLKKKPFFWYFLFICKHPSPLSLLQF